MSGIGKRIERVVDWLAGVSRKSPGRGGAEFRSALSKEEIGRLAGSKDYRSVRRAVMNSLDGESGASWKYQGIYLWHWERKDSSAAGQAWPLYVGKTRALSGMRGRHCSDHTMYPTPDRGKKDMLCDPIESRAKRRLMIFGPSGVVSASEDPLARSSDDSVGENMCRQFEPMSVLLLPMSPNDIEILGDAEGAIIAAAELIHQEMNGARLGELSCMMNSKGRASSFGLGFEALCKSGNLIEPIASELRVLLKTSCTANE